MPIGRPVLDRGTMPIGRPVLDRGTMPIGRPVLDRGTMLIDRSMITRNQRWDRWNRRLTVSSRCSIHGKSDLKPLLITAPTGTFYFHTM